jgi:CubicO group peptidase (beta-lactamase class C family)
VDQGRLSLDDDVRKYVPELPDYGQRITINELVHHTSGLRDFWALVETAGMRLDDTYAVSDVLDLAARQKHLEFAPGTEYDYSNTGYVVLGEIVRRVSGESLARFEADEIFTPLGMTHTHFQDDHTVIVPGRAYAYSPRDGGWRIDVWNNDIVGQGGLMTTVEDLQKWDENFYTGRVGGPRFLARQLEQGRLANGTVLAYAFGLEVETYRGLKLVEHAGSTGGYRTIISRFPTAHTSVVVLCNASNVNTTTLSHQVADVVLASSFTAPPPAPRAPSTPRARQSGAMSTSALDSADAEHLAGRYHSDELDATFAIRDSLGTLLLQRPRTKPELLFVTGPQVFHTGNIALTFNATGFTLDAGRARGIEFVKVP